MLFLSLFSGKQTLWKRKLGASTKQISVWGDFFEQAEKKRVETRRENERGEGRGESRGFGGCWCNVIMVDDGSCCWCVVLLVVVLLCC